MRVAARTYVSADVAHAVIGPFPAVITGAVSVVSEGTGEGGEWLVRIRSRRAERTDTTQTRRAAAQHSSNISSSSSSSSGTYWQLSSQSSSPVPFGSQKVSCAASAVAAQQPGKPEYCGEGVEGGERV